MLFVYFQIASMLVIVDDLRVLFQYRTKMIFFLSRGEFYIQIFFAVYEPLSCSTMILK
jgi:hypothetical protein